MLLREPVLLLDAVRAQECISNRFNQICRRFSVPSRNLSADFRCSCRNPLIELMLWRFPRTICRLFTPPVCPPNLEHAGTAAHIAKVELVYHIFRLDAHTEVSLGCFAT